MLLPLIGFTQNASELLVRWEGTRINYGNPTTQPMYYNTSTGSLTSNGDITASNATGSGISFNGEPYSGFMATGWDTGNPVNYNKYYQLTLTAGAGKQVEVKNLRFNYKGYCKRYTVVYQKSSTGAPSNSSFSSATVLTSDNNATNDGNTQATVNAAFPSGYYLLPGETLYIRIYGHKVDHNNNKWFLVHNSQQNNVANPNSVGPALYGVISNTGGGDTGAGTAIEAIEDNASTAKNNDITLDVIANDNIGENTISTIALTGNPSHGTVTVNSDKTLTYDPTNGYTGDDSFVYTITSESGNSSSATVNMTVLNPNLTGTLCGTYYVGTNGDFATITEAVDHLNSYGVTCPVTFILKNTTYNNASGETFPITINNFTGSTAVNTVTFKPNTGINVQVEANGGTSVPAVFKLNGADNIVFDGSNSVGGSTRNLTIKNNNNTNYKNRSVIWIASNGSNGATNNTVKYCNIRQEYRNDNYVSTIGVIIANNQTTGDNADFNTATADNANLTVLGNDFMNVKQGVYIEGNATTRTTNVVISQNDLGAENNNETIIQPAYLSNVNGFEYTENYVYNLYRDSNGGNLRSAGIHIANNSTNGYILKNIIRDLTRTTTDQYTFAGITLASTNNNANIIIANNTILNVIAKGNNTASENGHGINVHSGGGYKIYHNTVVLNINQPVNGYTSALYVHSDVNGSLDVRNNIFVNNQTTGIRRTAILVNKSVNNINSIFSHLDYNNYYSNDKIGFISTGGSTDWSDNPDYQTTLSGWQSATGKEANSISVNPVFASSSDLHLASNDNDSLNNLGTPLATVTKDIDGQVRNTTTPDMGADEFGPIQMPTGDGTGEGIYCDTSVTWNGTEWIGGEPTASTDVIFAGDYTQNSGTFYACSMFVIEGASVVFENNSNAIVTHSVNVEEGSALTFESSSNLIQIENTANEGTVTVKRNSSMIKRLDYTIWSSPVTGTQTLLDFSPQTLTNRFYGFNVEDNVFSSIADPASTLFEKGNGYLIRVANNHSSTAPAVYHGEFVGTPNNGTVRVPMEYTNGDQSYKMVGNPYASPININKFIDANIDNIDGTLWVWRKTNDPTKTTYCTINKMGWVANNAPGGNNGNGGNELVGNPFDITAGGVLNTGQGFFVRALNDNDLIFRNNMREAVNFNNFFRTENTDEQEQDITNQTNRYWINVVTEDESVFSQILVAHSALATNDYDNGYDGKAFLDGDVSLYTIVEGATEEDMLKLSIQSRASFTANDTVKVGFSTEVAGTFSFKIDHMDGLFAEGQNIYLVDKFTNTTYNLANGNYTFDSEIGVFENRFEIIYTIEALGTDTPEFTKDEVVVYQNNKELSINAPQNIESVVVYDLLGKVVYQNTKVDSNELTTTLNTQQQVAIVMITLENNQVVSKKIMVN